MKRSAVLACLSLLGLIASCASEPTVITEIRYEYLPETYLAPCAKPAWQGTTWIDTPGLALERGKAIDDCNDRLREAREYQAKQRAREAATTK